MTQVVSSKNLDQRVVLNGTWEQFKLIQKAVEDSPGVKLAFFAGTIEILMPGFQHENFSEIIGYLVTTFLLMQGIRFYPSGSMTQLPKYRNLGVPEVWFWEDGMLRLYHLRQDGYEEVIQSKLSELETLEIELLKRCILIGETNFAEAVKVFQQGISTVGE